jgi:predicted dehydrogenase
VTRNSPGASAPASPPDTSLQPDTSVRPNTSLRQDTAAAQTSAPDTPAAAGPSAPRIALVGAHGYGARHLENLARLAALTLVDLVAVADPRPPAEGTLPDGVATFPSLAELLATGPAPDVVILATPIQTHAPLALAALAAGADVYVEKPPMASLAQYDDVLAAAGEAGRLVQVGFQSLGSHALTALDRLVADGEIGDVRGVSAVGTWVRTTGYFKRSRWAGKRSLDGTDVVDGVATNALAHAVATGLRIAGAASAADVASVETDLYRAHATESDDTSVIRVRTSTGTVLMCALTLCAEEQTPPSVTVNGTRGQAEFFYTEDRLTVSTPDGERTETFGRTDLLENLLAARRSGGLGSPLLSPLAGNGAFMRVLEAIRTAEPPRGIGPGHVTWKGDGDDAHPVVHGIGRLVRRAAAAQATFAELGTPWARELPGPGHATAGTPGPGTGPQPAFTVNGKVVARSADGARISPTSSPRPYLHPVSTLAGTTVTDHMPEDHVWHLGVGVAIQDVDGVNFWGGRTYTRDAGAYVWRKDHGRIITVAVENAETASAATQGVHSRTETLSWLAPDGAPLLGERRKWSWAAVGSSSWRLSLDFELTPAGSDPVALGSPGSNGRPQGGYGGFFWRLPAVDEARVWTAIAEGEDAVHGARPRPAAPWLAWSGMFRKGKPDGGPATLVFLPRPAGATEPQDPWFVRMAGYPGVGLSLAWEHAAAAGRDNPLRRSVTVLVADGRLSTVDIEQLITTLGESA